MVGGGFRSNQRAQPESQEVGQQSYHEEGGAQRFPCVIKLLEWFVYVSFILTPKDRILPGSEFRTGPEVSEHSEACALRGLPCNSPHVDISSPVFMPTCG